MCFYICSQHRRDLGSKYKCGRISSGHPKHPRASTFVFVGSCWREQINANKDNNKLAEYKEEILKDRGVYPLIIMIVKILHMKIIQCVGKVLMTSAEVGPNHRKIVGFVADMQEAKDPTTIFLPLVNTQEREKYKMDIDAAKIAAHYATCGDNQPLSRQGTTQGG